MKTIRSKLIIWFLVIGIVPLVFGMGIYLIHQIGVLQSVKTEHLVSIRDLKVRDLEHWFQERRGDMNIISGDLVMRQMEHLIPNEPDSDAHLDIHQGIQLLLDSYRENYDAYSEMHILDPENGAVWMSTDPAYVGHALAGNTYYELVREARNTVFPDIRYSEEAPGPEMVIASPVYSATSPSLLVGIVVAVIDLESSLYPILLDRVGMGASGETLIVNSNSVALNELRWYKDAPLKLSIQAEPARRGSRGETGVIVADDYRGVKVLAAYTHLPMMGWGFVSKQDVSEIYEPVSKTIRSFMLILLLSLILVTGLAIYVSGSISKPIRSITDMSLLISEGHSNVRIPESGSLELVKLSRALNTMNRFQDLQLLTSHEITNIFKIIGETHDPAGYAEALLQTLMEATGCHLLVFYALDEEKKWYQALASLGGSKEVLKKFAAEAPGGEAGLVISTGNIQYLRPAQANTPFQFTSTTGSIAPHEIICIPLNENGDVAAMVVMAHLNTFPEHTMDILKEALPYMSASYNLHLANDRLSTSTEELRQVNARLEEQSQELQEQTSELVRQSRILNLQNLELDAKRKEVEEASRLKSEFLSNVSHELRTPLNSILSLSKTLVNIEPANFGEKEFSYLHVIMRNGENLLRLINDILDLSRVEAGKLDIRLEKSNAGNILRSVAESLNNLAEQKGIALKVKVDPGLPDFITDPQRMHQIFINLVSNAIKFTEKGEVAMKAYAEDQTIVVKVRDTGIGLKEEDFTRIFEQFTQADGSTSRRYEGTGLGLAIVKELTGILQGTIGLESELDEGTEFTLRFPLEIDPEVQAREVFTQEVPINTEILEGVKVLLVEDNEEAILQLGNALKEADWSVALARNAGEALDRLEQSIPEVIILDLMMPHIDGFQLLNEIRTVEEYAEIPVMVLTAKDLTENDLERLTMNNVHQLLQKGNTEMNDLLSRASMLARESRYRSMLTLPGEERHTLLIIEDNPDILITLKAILGEHYDIIEARDGDAGLQMAMKSLPSLILLDIRLPGKSGMVVFKEIRSRKALQMIPVIALTKGINKDEQTKLKALDFNDIIHIPVGPVRLLKTIEKNLQAQ